MRIISSLLLGMLLGGCATSGFIVRGTGPLGTKAAAAIAGVVAKVHDDSVACTEARVRRRTASAENSGGHRQIRVEEVCDRR